MEEEKEGGNEKSKILEMKILLFFVIKPCCEDYFEEKDVDNDDAVKICYAICMNLSLGREMIGVSMYHEDNKMVNQ